MLVANKTNIYELQFLRIAKYTHHVYNKINDLKVAVVKNDFLLIQLTGKILRAYTSLVAFITVKVYVLGKFYVHFLFSYCTNS